MPTSLQAAMHQASSCCGTSGGQVPCMRLTWTTCKARLHLRCRHPPLAPPPHIEALVLKRLQRSRREAHTTAMLRPARTGKPVRRLRAGMVCCRAIQVTSRRMRAW